MLLAGIDLKLYDSNLNLVDEIKRKKRENSIKHIISVKEDRLILATNSDLEIYGLVYSIENETKSSSFKLKELKLHLNAHADTILYLNKISGTNKVIILKNYRNFRLYFNALKIQCLVLRQLTVFYHSGIRIICSK